MEPKTILEAEYPEKHKSVRDAFFELGKQLESKGAIRGFEMNDSETKTTGVYIFTKSGLAIELVAIPQGGDPHEGILTVATLIKYHRLLKEREDYPNTKAGNFVSEIGVTRVDYTSLENPADLRQSLLRTATAKLNDMKLHSEAGLTVAESDQVRNLVSLTVESLRSPPKTTPAFGGMGTRS